MDGLAQVLAALPSADPLRGSAMLYALVNAAHLLGIALLLGTILPLDLRLLGILPGPSPTLLAGFMSRIAGAGLALAMLTGLALVSVRPAEYLANPAFRAKAVLIGLALVNLALVHAGRGWRDLRSGAGPASRALRAGAAISAMLWLGVLLAGRLIGFL